MASSRTPRADLLLALSMLVVSVAVWWATASLPPPKWEPLGSASVPRGIAGVLALLALGLGAQALAALRGPRSSPTQGAAARGPVHWCRALATVLLTVVFIAVMQMGLLDFIWAAAIFVAAVTLVLADITRRSVVAAVLFALLLVGLCDVVFTHIFYVDLP